MVRIFAWLSLLVVLVIAAVGLIRSVIHFTLKVRYFFVMLVRLHH